MCFGGSTKAPDVPATPSPSPTPISPSSTSSALSQTDRAKTLTSLKYGLASTLKTPTGFTGTGTQLQSAASSVTGATTKKTLG